MMLMIGQEGEETSFFLALDMIQMLWRCQEAEKDKVTNWEFIPWPVQKWQERKNPACGIHTRHTADLGIARAKWDH